MCSRCLSSKWNRHLRQGLPSRGVVRLNILNRDLFVRAAAASDRALETTDLLQRITRTSAVTPPVTSVSDWHEVSTDCAVNSVGNIMKCWVQNCSVWRTRLSNPKVFERKHSVCLADRMQLFCLAGAEPWLTKPSL